jgi:ankyrin repeat protein
MESQPKPDEANERCRSILGAAIEARDIETVRAVLKHYDREEYLGKDNGILMSLAIESDDLEIVQALVAAKVKPYKANISLDKHYAAPKNNALMIAGSQPDKFASSLGRFGLLRLLFGSLSSEQKVTESCMKAVQHTLEETCRHGDLDMFHLMIDVLRASSGRMLCEASSSGNQQLVWSILQTGIDVNEGDMIRHEFVTPLVAASKAGHEHIVQFLLLEGADPKRTRTPLVSASAEGHIAIVRILLEYGADIEEIDMYAANGISPLSTAIMYGHSAIARMLIEGGAEINRTCNGGRSALWRAVEDNNATIARLLINRRANVNVSDEFGETPLSIASKQGFADITKLLLENGAVKQPNMIPSCFR